MRLTRNIIIFVVVLVFCFVGLNKDKDIGADVSVIKEAKAHEFNENGATTTVAYEDANKDAEFPVLAKEEVCGGVDPWCIFAISNLTASDSVGDIQFYGVDVLEIKEFVEDVTQYETVYEYGEPYDVWSNFLEATTTTQDITGSHQSEIAPRDEWHDLAKGNATRKDFNNYVPARFSPTKKASYTIPAGETKFFKAKLAVDFNGFEGNEDEYFIEWISGDKSSVLDPFYNSEYKYCQKWTVQSSKVGTTTTAFPVLATSTQDIFKNTANGGHMETDDASDLIWTDGTSCTGDHGNILDFEKELHSTTTGQIVYWIESPVSSTSNETLLVYYGNSFATDQSTTTGVWDADLDGNSVPDFSGVWHFAEDPSIDTDGDCGGGSDEICDSTLNDNDGNAITMASNDLIDSPIGKAWQFNGSNDYVIITDDDTLDFDFDENYTIDLTFRIPTGSQPDTGSTINAIVAKWSNFAFPYPYQVRMRNQTTAGTADDFTLDTIRYDLVNSTFIQSTNNNYNDGEWHNLTTWKSGSTLFLKLDDSALQSTATLETDPTTNSSDLTFANAEVQMIFSLIDLDEIRISEIGRNAGWTQTSHNNRTDVSTFLTFGSEETQRRIIRRR